MTQRISTEVVEVHLLPLRTCLVNLPPSLVAAINDANIAIQNIIVEIQFQLASSTNKEAHLQSGVRSVYTGWTGINATSKSRELLSAKPSTRMKDAQPEFIEIDSAFARLLGLHEGHKAGIVLHDNPPLAHTINVEPLTPSDWEVIELHASFLETNLLAQIRAVPNPSAKASSSYRQQPHPIAIHLSPTSTANIVVTSITPQFPPDVPFVKLAPDAEVIIAPKVRGSKNGIPGATSDAQTTSTHRRSAGGRSSKISTHSRNKPIFLRGLNYEPSAHSHLEERQYSAHGPKIWMDEEMLRTWEPSRPGLVLVSVVRSLQEEQLIVTDQQQTPSPISKKENPKPRAPKIVANVLPWTESPDASHVLLDRTVTTTLGLRGVTGATIRIDKVPSSISRSLIRKINVMPSKSTSSSPESIKIATLGSGTNLAVERIRTRLRKSGSNHFTGPLTNGMSIPLMETANGTTRERCVLTINFEFTSSAKELSDSSTTWFIDDQAEKLIHVPQEIPGLMLHDGDTEDLDIAGNFAYAAHRIKIPLTQKIILSLRNSSSVLVCGLPGSGKSLVLREIGYECQHRLLFHVSSLDCQKLWVEKARITAIRKTIDKTFEEAMLAAKLGSQSLVLVDDLDKLCAAETELQVQRSDERMRMISEVFVKACRRYCNGTSRVMVLASCREKDSIHSVITSNAVLKDTFLIKAPAKEERQVILHKLISDNSTTDKTTDMNSIKDASCDGAWMDEPVTNRHSESPIWFNSQELDIRDIARETDGYMPGDLELLYSRARNEAVIRVLQSDSMDPVVNVTTQDFTKALDGFRPASLRNVALQRTTTKFHSVGGLWQTRKTLLETLKYPSTYRPIFANCPLRLRSGLLLYGYPGCGKTLVASAVAGECGLNFISIKGPEILNKYIGASEKSVRDLFQRAEAAAPCILFFDEFDSIAPKRGHDSTGVTDRVVNQLLTQMDGAEAISGVYVLAATSRPDLIDPALLRPGRLDKCLFCSMPSLEERVDILRSLSAHVKIEESVLNVSRGTRDLKEIAVRTEYYSGADLQAVIYNAHLEAVSEVLGHQMQHKTQPPTFLNGIQPERGSRRTTLLFPFRESGSMGRTEAYSIGSGKALPTATGKEITSQLRDYQLYKKSARLRSRGDRVSTIGSSLMLSDSHPEVVIRWKHLAVSLAATRRSIDAAERIKFEKIYKEFAEDRKGEMPAGQAPTEIGARSSLM